MKRFAILLFIMMYSSVFSQSKQKKYQYAIVPLQYNFTSQANQFQLNVLTRKILQDEGFEVYMSEGEELPKELAKNKCLALRADVKKDKGLLTSNLRFQLFNCFGNLVFESSGRSREKDFKKSYQEALREAMLEFQLVSQDYVKKADTLEEVFDNQKTDNKSLSFEESAQEYMNMDKSYWLWNVESDYTLFSDKGDTVFATLTFVDKGTYTYKSDGIEGAAYFTADGHLVVEYLAKNKDAVQKLVFNRK